jgi:hypothetical protein
MAHCRQRVRFAATWREKFFEVPYNPFEKGRRRITIDVATKIRDRYGISLDWIYCAEQRVLPSDLYQKLASIAA